jgi:hypothetical protein
MKFKEKQKLMQLFERILSRVGWRRSIWEIARSNEIMAFNIISNHDVSALEQVDYGEYGILDIETSNTIFEVKTSFCGVGSWYKKEQKYSFLDKDIIFVVCSGYGLPKNLERDNVIMLADLWTIYESGGRI